MGHGSAQTLRLTTFISSTRPAELWPHSRETDRSASMKALTEGRYRSQDGNTVLFDIGPRAAALATIRVSILGRDIGRVTLAEGYRLVAAGRSPRMSWSHILPAGRGTTCRLRQPTRRRDREQRHCDPVRRGSDRGGDVIALRDRPASSRGGGAGATRHILFRARLVHWSMR
jgi:hypothetical protein